MTDGERVPDDGGDPMTEPSLEAAVMAELFMRVRAAEAKLQHDHDCWPLRDRDGQSYPGPRGVWSCRLCGRLWRHSLAGWVEVHGPWQ